MSKNTDTVNDLFIPMHGGHGELAGAIPELMVEGELPKSLKRVGWDVKEDLDEILPVQ